MNIVLISSLLGIAEFVVAALEEGQNLTVTVWPPGSSIYLGECVLLQCTVESNSTFMWNYRWYRHRLHTALTPNPRHLVSGDSYSITAVTREDAGTYWCEAEQRERNTSRLSSQAVLVVSEPPILSLNLTQSTRQLFKGKNISVQCHASQTKWRLRQFHPGRKETTTSKECSESEVCVFTPASGLYWCESAEGRSRAVNITVSYGNIILNTPAFPISEGDEVSLYCQYRTGNHNKATFFKNGAEILTLNSSSLDNIIKMTIENVTQADEGFYKCASQDRKMESPESWLSVNPSRDGTEASTSDSWKWILVSCGVVLLLLLIPLTVRLVHRHRYQMFCTRSCWPLSKEDIPAVGLPVTKQDVTEVQWDLSWMEMSNLLDKQPFPGT
ncbi:Fc receptor-like protein 2 [Parambassis ranga]|uniref:Fc receptor-like protein 2 n=1 Tax=Parambassis ranga TaxID=210632 RepID=A0A6P7IB53_9TELE|nr:Fc receptor-like protein 2 [Parambassis ranga]